MFLVDERGEPVPFVSLEHWAEFCQWAERVGGAIDRFAEAGHSLDLEELRIALGGIMAEGAVEEVRWGLLVAAEQANKMLVITDASATINAMRNAGGKGSGNFGHAGRPGEIGGSAPEAHSSFWEGLSDDEELQHLEYYTGGASGVNEFLRYGHRDVGGEEDVIRSLDALMESTAKPMELYRLAEVKHFEHLKVGDEFIDKGYASTTSRLRQINQIAEDVGLDEDSTHAILFLTAPTGSKLLDVNKRLGTRHDYAHQHEHVLARGTKFRVTKVARDGQMPTPFASLEIHAEIIP